MASAASDPASFELFTSLRLDPILRKSRENSAFSHGRESPLYMAGHHQNRLLEAAEEFGFNCTEGLKFLNDGAQFEDFIVQQAELWNTENEGNDSSSPLRVVLVA